MKARIVEVGTGWDGEIILPIPTGFLKELNWKHGEEIRLELVTDRKGKCTHIVLELGNDV